MSSIVFQTDKKTGNKYAYESFSYWDKEKKQPRSKRRYIGRVDPDTGEIIRRSERVAAPITQENASASLQGLQAEIREKDKQIESLKRENAVLSKRLTLAVNALSKIEKTAKIAISSEE